MNSFSIWGQCHCLQHQSVRWEQLLHCETFKTCQTVSQFRHLTCFISSVDNKLWNLEIITFCFFQFHIHDYMRLHKGNSSAWDRKLWGGLDRKSWGGQQQVPTLRHTHVCSTIGSARPSGLSSLWMWVTLLLSFPLYQHTALKVDDLIPSWAPGVTLCSV